MKLNEIEAIVAVGRVGLALAASRMMSLVAVTATAALGAYEIASPPTWQGVVVVSLMAVCAVTALRLETRGRDPASTPAGGQDG